MPAAQGGLEALLLWLVPLLAACSCVAALLPLPVVLPRLGLQGAREVLKGLINNDQQWLRGNGCTSRTSLRGALQAEQSS